MRPYKSIKEKMEAMLKEGDLSLFVQPLDFLILEKLPEEGTQFGGLYQLGETTRSVEKALREEHPAFAEIPSTNLHSRFTSMNQAGLLHKVKALGREGSAWQRSQLGEEALKLWRQSQK